jgi:hypothetical protein
LCGALLALALAGCGGNTASTPEATPTTPPPDTTLPAVQAVREDLAGRFQHQPDDVQVLSVTIADWPDACLGLGEPDEACAQVETPGYTVVVQLAESTYTYRTDKTGAVVRFAGIEIGSNPVPTPTPTTEG